MKTFGFSSVWTGLIAAFAASSCCILPLVVAIGGASSGFVSSLAWVDQLRPYLIVTTLGLFGLAISRAYRPKEPDDCGCADKPSFKQSKAFLWLVLGLSLLLMAFPYYSKVFYPAGLPASVRTKLITDFKTVTVNIEGMTCTGCEEHVNLELGKISGVLESVTSYDAGNTIVKFDPAKTRVESIYEAVKKAGYEPNCKIIITNIH